jgi:uncharacterized protein YndB with AHSA1/START domain
MPTDNGIHWPEEFANAPVRVSNEIVIEAPPEKVWALLIRAVLWPCWYPNSHNVKFDSEAGPDLKDETKFRWKTFDTSIASKVREFIPAERLAWDGSGRLGIRVYHAWLFRRVEGGCHVLTEERQLGWLCTLGDRVRPHHMSDGHQLWLERLRWLAWLTGPIPTAQNQPDANMRGSE